jgi:polyferredoxin
VILFAIVMTFIQKKRSYCSNVCPVGHFQDRMYKPKDNQPKKLKDPALLRKVIFVIFWAYLIISIAILSNQTALLWVKVIQLMLFSLFSALLLQYFYRKRYWCGSVCPVGSVLKHVVKLRHRQIQINLK